MLKYLNLTLNVRAFLQREQVGECWKLKVSKNSPSLLPCTCSKGHYSNPPLALFQRKQTACQPQGLPKLFPLLFPQKVRKR